MKCPKCGSELKRLFYVDSMFCPNDCDLGTVAGPSGVSDETRTPVNKKVFKQGDKVRIKKYMDDPDDDHSEYYKIGEAFYFCDSFDEVESYNCRIASTEHDAMKGCYRWFAHTDELELVKD